MSLKGKRYVGDNTDISYFCNSTLVKGGIGCIITSGSGASLDQAQNAVGYAANPSGLRPVGIILNDVVDQDLTRTHKNYYKDETQVGGKVTVLRKGWVVTNNINGTPAAGDYAHATTNGDIMPITPANELTHNRAANPLIGTFDSVKDEDGYAKVTVDL